MKKNNIIIISIIAVVALIVLGIFLFQKNNDQPKNQQMPGNQDVTELSADSLELGNWVSVMATKGSDGTYTAEMINVCESKDSCSSTNSKQQGGQTPPSGSAPTGDRPSGGAPTGSTPTGEKGTANKSMLSGTIMEVSSGSIVLELDTGETATVTLSDSTKIIER